MKIAVVGAGAVGGYYGAMLARDHRDVHFLLRSDYAIVKRRGLRIESPNGDFHLNPTCRQSPQEIGESDLVLVALKSTANEHFETLIRPLVKKGTVILTLQNGLGNEESLAGIFGADNVMGGLCFVCINRDAAGEIRHIAQGQITIGEFSGWPEPRTHDIASMFRHAGVPCKVTASLQKSRWEKLVWNITFNGLGVGAAAGYENLIAGKMKEPIPGKSFTTDLILADEKWRKLAGDLMLEIIHAAQQQGLDLRDSLADKYFRTTPVMGAYKPSTVLDFEDGRELEMETMFLEPLRRAKKAGAEVPLLQKLCNILLELDSMRLAAANRPKVESSK